MLKVLIVLTVLCAVIQKTKSDYRPHGIPYSRYKRIRHPGPPHKIYNRPISHGFSHTPPRYIDNAPSSIETYNTKPKPVKRPNEDLEEDLQSFLKHLSSQDLDKIVEYAGQNKDIEGYNKEPNDNQNYQAEEFKTVYNTLQESEYPPKDNTQIHDSEVRVIDLNPEFSQDQFDDNYINEINYMSETTPAFDLYSQQNEQAHYSQHQPTETQENYNQQNEQAHYSQHQPTKTQENYNQQKEQAHYSQHQPSNTQENYFQQNEQAHYNPPNPHNNFQTYSEQENDDILFSGIKDMPEVDLPLPLNLREDDFEVADTKNTPTVALPSYQVEDFGNLPLMNYHSKKDTLSSYHVPHYTVTSKSTYSAPPPSSYTPSYRPSQGNIPVEPAPPASAAKYQSDANQKAVKIWATRSKGWAYTLHDDGSLTLEKYGKPKYGHHR